MTGSCAAFARAPATLDGAAALSVCGDGRNEKTRSRNNGIERTRGRDSPYGQYSPAPVARRSTGAQLIGGASTPRAASIAANNATSWTGFARKATMPEASHNARRRSSARPVTTMVGMRMPLCLK